MKKERTKYSDGKDYRVIAVCYARFDEQLTLNAVRQMIKSSEKTKCKYICFATCSNLKVADANDRGDLTVFDVMEVERFDAVILFPETFKGDLKDVERIAERCHAAGVPVITIDKELPDCYNVVFGYDHSFEKIVRHVVEGHNLTKVNFISGVKNNEFANTRLRCYRKVLEENGIPYDERRVGYGDFWEEPAERVVEEFLASEYGCPEAIICANDAMALAACRILKEHGYRVPEDVIVTGFDGIALEKFHTPRLTTAEYDMDELVRTIQRLVDTLAKGKKPAMKYEIEYKFRISCSCGCVPVEVQDSTDKVYELALKNKNDIYSTQDAFQMVSKLGMLDNLTNIFEQFDYYARNLVFTHLWFCTNEGLLDDNFDITSEVMKRVGKRKRSFGDTMELALQKIRWQAQFGGTFAKSDLIPDLDAVLQETEHLVVLPLHAQDMPMGYVAGCLDMNNPGVYSFYVMLMNFMQVLSNYRVQAERENYFNKDQLTNLYNRRGFYKYVNGLWDSCVEKKHEFAVLSIDMDGLKTINDTYGHKEGDFALHTFAEILQNVTKSGEYTARFGGDEFMVAIGGRHAGVRMEEFVTEVQTRINEFNSTAECAYPLRASYGTYCAIPGEENSMDEYVKCADHNMYNEKHEHKAGNYRERSRK